MSLVVAKPPNPKLYEKLSTSKLLLAQHASGVLECAALGRLACIDRHHGYNVDGLIYQLTRALTPSLMRKHGSLVRSRPWGGGWLPVS